MAFTFNLNCYDGFGSYCQDFRDVAAVFHIEPEHNPRAGKPSLTWFALTRKGGQLIRYSNVTANWQFTPNRIRKAPNH